MTNTYDALGNLTYAQHPVPSQFDDDDASYTWGNLGQLLATARTGGSPTINSSFGYDALGRLTTQTSVQGTVTTAYDAAGNRTRLTWPDGFYVTYDHHVNGETTAIRENGATSGAGVLEAIGYDDLGRRTSLVRGNGTSTSYAWDGISRFFSLTHNLAGATQTEQVGYDASSEVTSRSTSNDGWAWTGAYNVNRSYSINGLNQPTTSGSLNLTWGAAGGLTSDGVDSYIYDAANRFIRKDMQTAMSFDGAGRVWSAGVPGQATRFLYDGQEAIAEYTVSGTLLRRYVHGPGVDEPLVWYEVNGGAPQRSHLYADRQGSIVATANDAGSLTAINAYDEYGLPNNSNGTINGRFGYTGQKYISEMGVYDFKARVYSPTLGRFMSPDPTGYGPGMNLYAYVGDDPVDFTDSSGLCPPGTESAVDAQGNVVVCKAPSNPGLGGGIGIGAIGGPGGVGNVVQEVLVAGRRRGAQSCQSAGSFLPVGTRITAPNGYYFGSVTFGLFAGAGGQVSFYTGVHVQGGIVVGSFGGFSFLAGVGAAIPVGTGVNYSDTNPLATGLSLSGQAGAGPVAYTYSIDNSGNYAGQVVGLGFPAGVGVAGGVSGSRSTCQIGS